MDKPYIVGIAGGSGSGKSHFLKKLLHAFPHSELCLLTQDNYYLRKDQQPVDARGVVDFDLPESVDSVRMYNDIRSLMIGQPVELEEYTFNNPALTAGKLVFHPAPVIVVEGILIFHFNRINALFDLRIFIDAREDIKIKRRIERDRTERGYEPEDVYYRYTHHVTPVFEKYVKPWREKADLVIPNNSGFDRGFEVLKDHLHKEVSRRR